MKEAIDPKDKTLTPGQELYIKWLTDNENMIDPENKPPEDAEPFAIFDQPFVEYLRRLLPDHIQKHMDSPTEGVDRLPEAYIRGKRNQQKPHFLR